MTLIKCPGCGHTVSSVASTCPQCSTLLSQYRFVQGQGGALTECRRCARKVLSGAGTCPYCGISRPGRRIPYWAVGLVTALAVPVLVVATLRDRAPEVAPPRPPPGLATEAPVVPPGPASPPLAKPAPPPPPPEARAEGAQPASPPPTQTKWTVDWTNVRIGRALDSPVVRVLRPGMKVRVSDRQQGWWTLYLDDRPIGYVAGSLLANQLPDSLPPDTTEGRRD